MKIRYALSAPILLIITIMGIKNVGNDKAPFFIIFPMILSALLFILSIISIIKNRHSGSEKTIQSYSCLVISSLPIIYTVVVILLSRQGMIDSATFLGFR